MDRRGIDVAFLSRFPVLSADLHSIYFSTARRSRIGDKRPILEAKFRLPSGGYITGFNVHFPASYHPTDMRESAFATLNASVENCPRIVQFLKRETLIPLELKIATMQYWRNGSDRTGVSHMICALDVLGLIFIPHNMSGNFLTCSCGAVTKIGS